MSDAVSPDTPMGASAGTVRAEATEARDAATAFRVLFAINLFNYLDRYVLPAALGSIQREFHFSDTQAGALSTAFILVYALAAFPFSLWADRGVRKNVLAVCVTLWSLATLLTGFATGFATLFAARAVVGIGEAGYFPAGTSLLSDHYPREARARVMSRWGAAQLIGLAIGFTLGGVLAGSVGWRAAFFVVAVPGLLFAWLAWRLHEPPRGRADGWATAPPMTEPLAGQLRALFATRTVVVGILIQVFAFWVLGAVSYWVSVYLQRVFGLSEGRAGIVSGAVLVVAGLVGVLLGGVLADRLTRRFIGGRVLVCGISLTLGVPCIIAALLQETLGGFLPWFLLTTICLSMYSGPLTAVTQDVVSPGMRALVVSVTLLIGHLFGDVTSPLIVGGVSDALGGGAVGLRSALLVTCPALLMVAGLVGLMGSRMVGRDLLRVEECRRAGR